MSAVEDWKIWEKEIRGNPNRKTSTPGVDDKYGDAPLKLRKANSPILYRKD